MKSIFAAYSRLYLTAIGMDGGRHLGEEESREADKERPEPVPFLVRSKQQFVGVDADLRALKPRTGQ